MAEQNTEILSVRKSNEWLTAKYQGNILMNKLVAISLTKVHVENEQVVSVLNPSEIRTILGRQTDSNIYRKLKNVSKNMAGSVITIEDKERNEFHSFSMITNVDYENGELKITFNKNMTPYIVNLKSGYTTMQLATLVSFDKNSSYRLYEVLKKEAYLIKAKKLKYVTKTYGLSELKAMLGLINTDASYIRRALDAGRTWDDIVENVCRTEDKQYDCWSDFKKRILQVAMDEMAEKADIRFEYTPEKSGIGGKINRIRFIIYPNEPVKAVSEQITDTARKITRVSPEFDEIDRTQVYESQEILEYGDYEEIRDQLLASGVKKMDAFTREYFERLQKLAGGELQVIRAAIDYGKNVPHIRNYFGWLTKAVEQRYAESETVEVVEGSTETADRIREFRETPVQDDIKASIWERYKLQEEFRLFLDYAGIPVSELEELYSCGELISMYIEFKKNRLW